MDRNRRNRKSDHSTDVIWCPRTLDVLKLWGADAIRDCDGTEFPAELADTGAKFIPLITPHGKTMHGQRLIGRDSAVLCNDGILRQRRAHFPFPLLKGISPELMQVNDQDDIKKMVGKSWTAPSESHFRRMRGRTKDGIVTIEKAGSLPRLYGKFSGISDLGSGTYVQCSHQ